MKGNAITLAITHLALAATLMALPAHDVMARSTPKSAQAWWPTTLDLTPLRQNEHNADPLVRVLITRLLLRRWILRR